MTSIDVGTPVVSPLALKRRARRMFKQLSLHYPDAHCELDFADPFQLLVATVLSAQTTDVRVNLVTPVLFQRYPDPAALAGADRAELEAIIQSTGFFRSKADALLKLSSDLVERFDGEIPRRLRDLVSLAGVGRKTANVVLGNAFGIPGITVDTHFGRLSRRFGWTASEDPLVVEAEVGGLLERKDWVTASHVLIFHGRRTCHARRPACGACPVSTLCPSYGEGETDPARAAKLVKPGPGGVRITPSSPLATTSGQAARRAETAGPAETRPATSSEPARQDTHGAFCETTEAERAPAGAAP